MLRAFSPSRDPGHLRSGPALWVGHWPVTPAAPAPAPAPVGTAFSMDTCMRRLVITAQREVASRLAALQPVETYSGCDAYRFLLEVATGLRSAVPGETNVFGQFRRAWEHYRQLGEPGGVRALAPLIARVIADTRRVREAHLRNLGGASYGSLVRRLLTPAAGERVLFVGAGELARSMLPFFRSFEIGVWNRRPAGPAFASAARLFAPAEGAEAAAWAHHVVMTTPADATNDEHWRAWLAASLSQTVVHLGRRRGDGWTSPGHVTGYDFDDMLDLRRSRDNIRSLQLERARLACYERAAALAAPPVSPRRWQATA